ncbi:MAG: Rrf2 family transcriptional regulator [bacterium]|nr:Rrf2 family transcriptional regulator [bacterium]
MKLSNRSQYGVRALFDIAYYSAGRMVQINEISRRQGIPKRFLEQIFFVLKKSGIIDSARGPKGGYSLRRPPEEVTVGEVIRVLEGPIEPVPCTTMEQDGSVCNYIDKCVTRMVWKEAGDLLSRYFDSITLQDLCRRAEKLGLKKDDECLMFTI